MINLVLIMDQLGIVLMQSSHKCQKIAIKKLKIKTLIRAKKVEKNYGQIFKLINF